MCSRLEVQEIVDRSTRELHHEFSRLREERDARMVEVANTQISTAKDSMMKFIGWGGIVGIAGAVYFFGGLTNQVENLQQDVREMSLQFQELDDFINSGDRFTLEDGNSLKAYSDQQDNLLQQQVDRNREDMKTMKEDIISEIRSLKE